MKRTISMECALYFKLNDGETQEQAEDRLIKALDAAGIDVAAWWDVKIEEENE